MSSHHQEIIRSHIRVDSAQRVVLPNSVCRALGIQPGDELTIVCTADGIQLQTVEHAVVSSKVSALRGELKAAVSSMN
jgi:bifunctional DNA-binding transcriptional regulator/antitoxin component of YhaV-PrlF toxin-antitoxin module